MRQKDEIGYLCSRGHFVLYGESDNSCGSKKIAGLFVEAIEDDETMFYEPYEQVDETGFAYYSSSGYSKDEYQEAVEEAAKNLVERLENRA